MIANGRESRLIKENDTGFRSPTCKSPAHTADGSEITVLPAASAGTAWIDPYTNQPKTATIAVAVTTDRAPPATQTATARNRVLILVTTV